LAGRARGIRKKNGLELSRGRWPLEGDLRLAFVGKGTGRMGTGKMESLLRFPLYAFASRTEFAIIP
jgi:hypothetical protein